MANEVLTSAGYTTMVNAEFLDPLIADALRDPVVALPACRFLDLRGKATKTGSFNRRTADAAAAITELGATSNTLFAVTRAQVTGAKFGIRRQFSEEIMNVAIESEAQIIQEQAKDAGAALAGKLEADVCALFPSLTASVSHSLLPMSWSYLLEAMAKQRTNKAPGSPEQWVGVLDDQAATDLEMSVASAGGTAFGVPGLQGILGGGDGAGSMGTLFRVPLRSTNLTTVGAGDGTSALMVDGSKIPQYAPIGWVLLWNPKTMTQANTSDVSYTFVHHMGAGAGIIHPSTGTKIIVRG